MRVERVSLSDGQVRDLLEAHERHMFEISPPGTSFALDLSRLSAPTISLFGAWEGNTLIAVGAINRLSEKQAEIKSMRTHAEHLGKGAAQAVLDIIFETARTDGIERMSLETGTSKDFMPAVKLYLKNGFEPGEAFAEYANGPHNQCYHLDIAR
ncbi:GNAT family N-acetyltransferase [Altererythrobacter sp.]|uniref:GNAT family N-acetyltransferase n=1 Tax=Altererythrobacter sp. TaxID=1872480 RepID=UPI001B2C25D9|nr:GNAT family N-acetyltransferase [Altererythrobacter sp.]MBO6609638.1 GNAT family N-acetyltransferase [Altererythrobacter sp.]MBO6641212.1 GNAT family N-acetyltransferase [Altererythrobacter sp.]MBO6708090.1 GNAT family N-acetyltransferase [Altererythrobacter sp.]